MVYSFNTEDGDPARVTLVIPTKGITVADCADFAGQRRTRVPVLMRSDYASRIEAVEIGNDYGSMAETTNGRKAGLAAKALADGFDVAGVAEEGHAVFGL